MGNVPWIKSNKVHKIRPGDVVKQGPEHNVTMQRQGSIAKEHNYIQKSDDDVE